MSNKKVSWDDIPSINGMEVDWNYKPEDELLGKRSHNRLINQDLHALIGVKKIPVKLLAKGVDETGLLIDIAQGGLAVLLKIKMVRGTPVKLGFFLGKQKMIANGMICHACRQASAYKTGVQFIEIDSDSRQYIASLMASKLYNHSK